MICRFALATLLSLSFAGCVTTQGTTSTQAAGSADTPEGFIPATGLSAAQTDVLWSTAIDGCYSMNYSVTFNDKSTGNLACQTQTQDAKSTYTMRVKFSPDGILVEVKSNSVANLVFGGVATKSDTQRMKSTLEAKLRSMVK